MIPTVSVVMSVYNGAAYVEAAIKSILGQTFSNFELIIIDDGSTDKTASILTKFHDKRLRIITQNNQGLVASLNTGIKQARGLYIARQDADDVSSPERLQLEYDLLMSNPNFVLVGSSMAVMDMNSKLLHEHYVLLNDAELRQELLIRSPFAHGSVMFKKEAFDYTGGYRSDEWPAEDYGLWLRMAKHGKFANINAPLYTYRENTGGISQQNTEQQSLVSRVIREKAWKVRRLLIPIAINTQYYRNLPMEHLRVERITRNITYMLVRALRSFDIPVAFAATRLLLSDRGITRKYARLVLVTLGFKHV